MRKRQGEFNRLIAVISHVDALMRDIPPKIHRPHDVDRIAWQYDLTIPVNIRVREVHRQRHIVVADA